MADELPPEVEQALDLITGTWKALNRVISSLPAPYRVDLAAPTGQFALEMLDDSIEMLVILTEHGMRADGKLIIHPYPPVSRLAFHIALALISAMVDVTRVMQVYRHYRDRRLVAVQLLAVAAHWAVGMAEQVMKLDLRIPRPRRGE